MAVPLLSRSGRSALAPPASVGASKLLRVSVAEQMRTNWCWAAVGLGVKKAYGTANGDEQCKLAGRVLGKAPDACCPDGDSCNDPHELPPALEQHFRERLDSHDPDHRIEPFVKVEIDGGHPIAIEIQHDDGSRHAVVVSGYIESAHGTSLVVWDPEHGTPDAVPFTEFRSNYKQHGMWDISCRTQGDPVPAAPPEAIHELVLE